MTGWYSQLGFDGQADIFMKKVDNVAVSKILFHLFLLDFSSKVFY
jgi:hypothetical protein